MDWMGHGKGLEIIFQMKFIQYPFQVQINRIKLQCSIVIILTRTLQFRTKYNTKFSIGL